MQHVFKQSEQRQLKRLYSEVSITARPFYQTYGFEVIQQKTVQIRGQILENFLMQKYVWY